MGPYCSYNLPLVCTELPLANIKTNALCFEICAGNSRKRYADSSGIVFDINTHSGKELHQFKLCGIELILSVLGNDNLVDKVLVVYVLDVV